MFAFSHIRFAAKALLCSCLLVQLQVYGAVAAPKKGFTHLCSLVSAQNPPFALVLPVLQASICCCISYPVHIICCSLHAHIIVDM